MRTSLMALIVGLAFWLPHASMAAPHEPFKKPSIVLVHGAFADGSSWSEIIPLLAKKGYEAIAVQNPLTSLAGDVAATRRALSRVKAPVVLVGHSWGGMVITEVGNDDRVAALVYVAALAPDVGESAVELFVKFPEPSPNMGIQPDDEGFLWFETKAMREDFAADVNPEQFTLIATTQAPIAAKAFGDKVQTAAWKTKPSWYVVANQDRALNPDLQRFLVKRMKTTAIALDTSHVPMISRPHDIARVIEQAAQAVALPK